MNSTVETAKKKKGNKKGVLGEGGGEQRGEKKKEMGKLEKGEKRKKKKKKRTKTRGHKPRGQRKKRGGRKKSLNECGGGKRMGAKEIWTQREKKWWLGTRCIVGTGRPRKKRTKEKGKRGTTKPLAKREREGGERKIPTGWRSRKGGKNRGEKNKKKKKSLVVG